MRRNLKCYITADYYQAKTRLTNVDSSNRIIKNNNLLTTKENKPKNKI